MAEITRLVRREIAFIDPSIPDLDSFLAGLRINVEAVVLNTAENPICQIARALEQRGSADAIHIVAHGEPGEVHFSAGVVTVETLDCHAFSLTNIGRLLDGGEFLLWSCETAAGAKGKMFLDTLANATGAHVAASTARVGAAAQGGAWELNAIAIRPPLTQAGIESYSGVLSQSMALKSFSSLVHAESFDPVALSNAHASQAAHRPRR